MEQSAYHETIYKSLQEMRAHKPVIMVLTSPEKMHGIQNFANSCGFRVIFPTLGNENLKQLKKISQGVVIDLAALLIEKNFKILENLGKEYLSKKAILNISDKSELFGREYQQSFRVISKYNIPLYILDYHISYEDVNKIINKSIQSVFRFKSFTKPLLLSLHPSFDRLHSICNKKEIDIIGLEDMQHSLNCPSIFYAILSLGLCVTQQPMDVCVVGSVISLRAASRRAVAVTNGPGSFLPVFTDALFHMKRDYIYQIKFMFNDKGIHNRINSL